MPSRDVDFRRNILDYLVHHPDAKDTLEGVLNWWIAQAHADERDEQDVVRALEELVVRGWVVRRDTSTRSIYSLNRTHVEDIRRFLNPDRRAN